jgi:hypothetical protein
MQYTLKLTCSPVGLPGNYVARAFITGHEDDVAVGTEQFWESKITLLDPYEHTNPALWALHALSQASSSLTDSAIAQNQGGQAKLMLDLFEHHKDLCVAYRLNLHRPARIDPAGTPQVPPGWVFSLASTCSRE